MDFLFILTAIMTYHTPFLGKKKIDEKLTCIFENSHKKKRGVFSVCHPEDVPHATYLLFIFFFGYNRPVSSLRNETYLYTNEGGGYFFLATERRTMCRPKLKRNRGNVDIKTFREKSP